MLLKITEQVFIPIHRVERISFFGTHAIIKFTDSRDTERVDNEDAQRLRMFVDSVTKPITQPVITVTDNRSKK
jgi:hypothetical protein